jgi:hypothetical protein
VAVVVDVDDRGKRCTIWFEPPDVNFAPPEKEVGPLKAGKTRTARIPHKAMR